MYVKDLVKKYNEMRSEYDTLVDIYEKLGNLYNFNAYNINTKKDDFIVSLHALLRRKENELIKFMNKEIIIE